MENLRKVISLHQASQISGYHPDYLSALIRKKEILGEKKGGNWFTTEEEIKNYIFKQKIRNKNWLLKSLLLFFKRLNRGLVYAFVCVIIFSIGLYFYNKNEIKTKAENAKLSNIAKPEVKEEFKELKF